MDSSLLLTCLRPRRRGWLTESQTKNQKCKAASDTIAMACVCLSSPMTVTRALLLARRPSGVLRSLDPLSGKVKRSCGQNSAKMKAQQRAFKNSWPRHCLHDWTEKIGPRKGPGMRLESSRRAVKRTTHLVVFFEAHSAKTGRQNQRREDRARGGSPKRGWLGYAPCQLCITNATS